MKNRSLFAVRVPSITVSPLAAIVNKSGPRLKVPPAVIFPCKSVVPVFTNPVAVVFPNVVVPSFNTENVDVGITPETVIDNPDPARAASPETVIVPSLLLNPPSSL